jgi:formylglycine-generating enzyme required for sulfatase activity
MAWDKNKRPQLVTKKSGRGSTPLYLSKPTSFSFEVVKVNERGQEISRHSSQAERIIEDLGNGVTLEMVLIPGGTFTMGAPDNEVRSSDDERPQHRVTIQPFLIGKYPVTQEQWQQVASFPKLQRDLESDPSYFKGFNLPVERVSWYDTIEWCARLSKKIGKPYRLPSEAEWEYAARAGTTTPFHVGEILTTDLDNFKGDFTYYRKTTTPVGQFQHANAFGLYDIHGNVREWCADLWHENYNGAPSDGQVWNGKNIYDSYVDSLANLVNAKGERVLRGGSWFNRPYACRSANRAWNDPNSLTHINGFRVSCSLPEHLSL